MTACDLIAFVGLLVLSAFHGLHQWILIRRQHAQIMRLEAIIALRDQNVAVGDYLHREQDLTRQNQPAAYQGDPRIRAIS